MPHSSYTKLAIENQIESIFVSEKERQKENKWSKKLVKYNK